MTGHNRNSRTIYLTTTRTMVLMKVLLNERCLKNFGKPRTPINFFQKKHLNINPYFQLQFIMYLSDYHVRLSFINTLS